MPNRRSAREIAEELKSFASRSDTTRDRLQLLHELQVYQDELTIQNEELMNAQAALEESRDLFVELYDLAPIGYLTLDPLGIILQINLTGATLLGKPRQAIESLPLLGFIPHHDGPRLLDFLRRCRNSPDGVANQTTLQLRTQDGERHVHLLCKSRRHHRTKRREFLTTIMDVTELYELQEARVRATRDHAELATRLISIQEDERQRIARDLHDNLGQLVTALHLKLEEATMVCQEARPRDRLGEAQEVVRRLDQQLDFIAAELRPKALDLGIAIAIEQFVREWSKTFSVEADFHAVGIWGSPLRSDVETHLYRVTQEALHNIYKHAGAAHVSVMLERRDGDVRLIIEDDGRGFDVEQASHRRQGGLGLVGMRERASIIGGALDVESKAGQGTTVFLRVPSASCAERRRMPRDAR